MSIDFEAVNNLKTMVKKPMVPCHFEVFIYNGDGFLYMTFYPHLICHTLQIIGHARSVNGFHLRLSISCNIPLNPACLWGFEKVDFLK